MLILDKAKTAAERARVQVRHGAAQGRARLMEVQARRQHRKLLRQLGEACYAEHLGRVGIITEADLARHLDEHRLAEFVEKVYTTA